MIKVCIDPGHGGKDPGAVLGARCEKEDVLRLALAVAEHVCRYGVQPILTRSDDRAVSIAHRCAFANAQGCAYFLSLHRDAAGAAAKGASVWVHSRANEQTEEKARLILQELLASVPLRSRGVNKGAANPAWGDYGVNRQTVMASALLEVGFVTNKHDNALFDLHFDACARSIARGICRAMGVL